VSVVYRNKLYITGCAVAQALC